MEVDEFPISSVLIFTTIGFFFFLTHDLMLDLTEQSYWLQQWDIQTGNQVSIFISTHFLMQGWTLGCWPQATCKLPSNHHRRNVSILLVLTISACFRGCKNPERRWSMILIKWIIMGCCDEPKEQLHLRGCFIQRNVGIGICGSWK